MSNVFKRFFKGILLAGETSDPSDNKEGSIFHNFSESRIKTYIGGAIREVITNSQGQSLTNKTIIASSNSIITAASGNLASTELNAALAELQTDVDSRVTTASNVGTGSGVFKQKSGSTLELKSLSAGANITITEVGDSLQLTASGTIGVNDATTSTKGIVKLAGDLGGTADLPKIIKPTSTLPALNVDWSLGYIYYKEISANSTFTFSNLEDGKTISLIIKNTGASTYNVVLPTAIKPSSIDLTIQAGKQNVYTFIATSTSVYATAVTQMA